jgi:hypothetical protein
MQHKKINQKQPKRPLLEDSLKVAKNVAKKTAKKEEKIEEIEEVIIPRRWHVLIAEPVRRSTRNKK